MWIRKDTLIVFTTEANKNKKNIKNVTRCKDSRSAKTIEKGGDDSIKQFSTQLHPTYLSTVRDM